MATGKTGARQKAEEIEGKGLKFILAGIALFVTGIAVTFFTYSTLQPLSVIGSPLIMVESKFIFLL